MLEKIIKDMIRQKGAMPFKEFMEIALYYPQLGYYTSGNERLGKSGDFFTAPVATWLFGHMIGKQLEEMWLLMGKGDFAIVEYGSGTNVLCRDILSYLKSKPEFYACVTYYLIEKNMHDCDFTGIPADKVRQLSSIDDLKDLCGCVLSNELLDNFPVHHVKMQQDLMEVFVALDSNGQLIEIVEPAGPDIRNYLHELRIMLPPGFVMEVNLEAVKWLKEISKALVKGFVLTVDYGYSLSDGFIEAKSEGTLHCYSKHRINHNFYRDIGKQDITAYVNFSALNHFGNKFGLQRCGYCNQSRFLHALGVGDYFKEEETVRLLSGMSSQEKTSLLQTLLLSMGQRFKVLIQQKGLGPTQLSGMKFSFDRL